MIICIYGCVHDVDQTNEGNEFYVGFFQNRFGERGERESIPPVLWVTTKESTPVSFNVTTIAGVLFSGVANRGNITYVQTLLELIVFESEGFKGIQIKAEDNRKIVVYGQHEELASNDAFLALPVITLPPGRRHEYIVASVYGSLPEDVSDSVALIIGTQNDTKITVIPSAFIISIEHPQAPLGSFFRGLSDDLNTITIDQFQTVYLQVRSGFADISGTRIIANKPISVFSGHECGNVPGPSDPGPCDMLIEQIPPIHTWGTEVVTIPLKTRQADLLKVIAAQDSTVVNITITDVDTGAVTADLSFILNSGGFREITIGEYTLIQSNYPISVFQFSRSWQTDGVQKSDPFMMYVPPFDQYRNSYVVATAPFDPSLEDVVSGVYRGPYDNYTNLVVPAKYFDVNLLMLNNHTANTSDFAVIKKVDNSIWGYGAQLLLDEGAQIISHQDPDAVIGITLYGFSNQMSWGYTGGVGLAPTTGKLIIILNE